MNSIVLSAFFNNKTHTDQIESETETNLHSVYIRAVIAGHVTDKVGGVSEAKVAWDWSEYFAGGKKPRCDHPHDGCESESERKPWVCNDSHLGCGYFSLIDQETPIIIIKPGV